MMKEVIVGSRHTQLCCLGLNDFGCWQLKPDKCLWCNPFMVGEILRMTHIARGLDSDGALLLDIVVNGHILQLPSHADINVKVNQ